MSKQDGHHWVVASRNYYVLSRDKRKPRQGTLYACTNPKHRTHYGEAMHQRFVPRRRLSEMGTCLVQSNVGIHKRCGGQVNRYSGDWGGLIEWLECIDCGKEVAQKDMKVV